MRWMLRPRKAGHARKCLLKVGRQAVDDLGAPAFAILPLDDFPADVPVEANQFPAGGHCRPDLGSPDAIFQVFQQFGVARRQMPNATPSAGCVLRSACSNRCCFLFTAIV